jgi:hypothetical protein
VEEAESGDKRKKDLPEGKDDRIEEEKSSGRKKAKFVMVYKHLGRD